MPKNKDLKRLARSRMKKTGESYTTARAQLLRKKTAAHSDAAVGPQRYAALAGMSDDAVRAKTGKTWAQWVRTLDLVGAVHMPHRDIARHLRDQHALSPWWSQTVTVGYERIRGLRDVGQRRDGDYEVSKSRTLPVSVARLYRAFRDARIRRRWLPGVTVAVRTVRPEKLLRMTWSDGTPVNVGFTAKAPGKSQVAIGHGGLGSRADAERIRTFWAERLDALAEVLGARR